MYKLETGTLPDLYARLRPNLVALVDAFDFHDHELGECENSPRVQRLSSFSIDSCLGRYDGQVYEALMERAQLNPTNQHKVKNLRDWKRN